MAGWPATVMDGSWTMWLTGFCYCLLRVWPNRPEGPAAPRVNWLLLLPTQGLAQPP